IPVRPGADKVRGDGPRQHLHVEVLSHSGDRTGKVSFKGGASQCPSCGRNRSGAASKLIRFCSTATHSPRTVTFPGFVVLGCLGSKRRAEALSSEPYDRLSATGLERSRLSAKTGIAACTPGHRMRPACPAEGPVAPVASQSRLSGRSV